MCIRDSGKADMDFDEKILDSEKKNASDLLYFSKTVSYTHLADIRGSQDREIYA